MWRHGLNCLQDHELLTWLQTITIGKVKCFWIWRNPNHDNFPYHVARKPKSNPSISGLD